MITKAQCHVCLGGPFVLKTLYNHLRQQHGCSEDIINEVKNATKKAIHCGKKEFQCEACSQVFYSNEGLRKHKKLKHSISGLPEEIKCPLCPEKTNSLQSLALHCGEHHSSEDTSFELTDKTFNSWEDFESWRSEKEHETCSKLVQRAVKRKKSVTTTRYVCQHARGEGGRIDAEEKKIRYKKSKRVYPQCPCFALVKQKEDGRVSVVACFGHLGHEINNATTRLSTCEEDVVLNMIKSGIPDQMIVVKLREEFWNDENPPERQARLCYLTTKDVYNIAARHGEVAGRWDPDDRTSLKVLLRNDEALAAVRLVETNDSSGDGFVLGKAFVSKNGKKYLERFGSRGVVMDDTFNVTRYSFRLASLIVSDDSGRGFPSAHLLSFHMTSAEVKILFELVKECVPAFNPSYVITDDTYVFFNGFKEVFPLSHAEKILCAFHVSQTLQRRHKELLRGDDVQMANDLFKAVLFEVNEAKFESYLYAYMSFLASIDAQDMINYVNRNYATRKKEWALCYRRKAIFTTSNHAEAWHNKLKHVLLKSKQNARLDTVLYVLLRHSENADFQLVTSRVRADICGRSKLNLSRHREALSFAKNPGAIVKIDERSWKVIPQPRANKVYIVTVSDTCDCDTDVNSHCERCGVCSYQFQCSCFEAYKAGVSCAHLHAVATFVEEAAALLRPVRHYLASSEIPLLHESENHDCAVGSEDVGITPLESTDNADEGNDENEQPRDILEEDRTKQAYQLVEGKISHLSELMRCCRRAGQHEVLERCANALEEVINLVPSNLGSFSRRQEMQTTGSGPKPKPIQFKTRTAILREKNQKNIFD